MAPEAPITTGDASAEDDSSQLELRAGGDKVAAEEHAKDKASEHEHGEVDVDKFKEADVHEIEKLLDSSGKHKDGSDEEEEGEGTKVGVEDEIMEDFVDLSVEAKVSACKVASAELERMNQTVVTINGEEINYEQKLLIAEMRVDSCKRAPQIRTETTTFGMVLDESSYKQLDKNRDEKMTAGEATELLSRLVTSINQGKNRRVL